MVGERKITVASWITLSRFVLVLIFIWFAVQEKYRTAMIVLLVAGFTDFLDGFLARRLHMRSRLGSMLDPLADKFLMAVSFLFLSSRDVIPWGLTAIVFAKDFWVLLGALVLNLMKIRLYYKPTILSKATTASQILVLVTSFSGVVFRHEGIEIPWAIGNFLVSANSFLLTLAAVLTLCTMIQYTYIGYKFYRYGERRT